MDEIIGVRITSDNLSPTSVKVFVGDSNIELTYITKLEISMVPDSLIYATITIPVHKMDILATADIKTKEK